MFDNLQNSCSLNKTKKSKLSWKKIVIKIIFREVEDKSLVALIKVDSNTGFSWNLFGNYSDYLFFRLLLGNFFVSI